MINKMNSIYPSWIKGALLSIGFSVIVIFLLELCRRNQVYGLSWTTTLNVEITSLRFLIISFYQLLFLFTWVPLKENKLVPVHVRASKYLCITYLLIVSWTALLLGFLDSSAFRPLQTSISYMEFTYLPVSIYLFSLFAKFYVRLLENSKKYYESSVTDSLTKLPNRILFYDCLDQLLVQASRQNNIIAVMFLDLDRFKTINDAYGHFSGDRVLRVVAERLVGCVRSSDIVSRLGGDEFTIILPNIKKIEDAEIVASKILTTLAQPIHIEGNEFYLTTSIGISFFPFDGNVPETIVKNADLALYMAKKFGKNKYQVFNQ